MAGNRPTFRTVDGGFPYRLRGTNQQTDTGLFWVAPSMSRSTPTYTTGTVPDTAGAVPKIEGAVVAGFDIHNRSAATIVVGIAGRLPNRLWIAGQWTSIGSVFTDDTTDAQDLVGANDFPMEVVGADEDGFIVASLVPFNCISINITTASADATNPVRDLKYSDAAGTGWSAAVTNLFIGDGNGAVETSTGENLIVFPTPLDWGKVTALGSIPTGYYAVKIAATTAPDTTAGIAASMEVWQARYCTEGIVDNATLSWQAGETDAAIFWPHVDAVSPLFGTLNTGNRATIQIRSA